MAVSPGLMVSFPLHSGLHFCWYLRRSENEKRGGKKAEEELQ
jgi:hypothetical protein